MTDLDTGMAEHYRRFLRRLGAQRAEVHTPGGRDRLRVYRKAVLPPQRHRRSLMPTDRQLAIAGLVILVVALFAVVAEADGATPKARAQQAICVTFRGHCYDALQVSACETGHTFSTRARNGQYLGLFQMGAYARSRYGHSWNAWRQARAAYRYFVASGRDWSPWSCRP